MISKIDFINGKTNSSLLKMFLPLLAAMTLTMIYSMVDSFWVGNILGEKGMSALTAGTAIILIMNSLSMGVGNGISVMVAKLVGANQKERLEAAIATIITVSFAISIALCVLSEILVKPLLLLMGIPAEIFSDANVYLKIYLLGNSVLFLYMQFTSIFRGFGDPVFQMKGMLVTAIFNAILDPLFIKMYGLVGAAIVTVASEVLCLLYAVLYYKKSNMFTIAFSKVNCGDIKTMCKLSVPTTIQAVMPAVSSAVMVSFITPFGLPALSGYGVARNLELIMFMPTTGMCMAVTAIVGQCMGAKRFDRAGAYLRSSLLTGGIMIALISISVIYLSSVLTRFFGQGDAVAKIVMQFFKVLSIGYVLYMLTSCMQGYITGLGKPGLAMVLLILYYLIFRIPAALILKSFFDLEGIWGGFLVSHILAFVTALVMVWICKITVLSHSVIEE